MNEEDEEEESRYSGERFKEREERNSPRTESIGNKPIATCTEVRVQIPLVRSDTRDP